jgi:simple sugar transport system permease protein
MASTTVTPGERSSTRVSGRTILIALLVFIGIAIVYFYAKDPRSTTSVLSGTIRQATPLILGALCGLIGERSGIINIGIEGQMLMAAFVAFMVNVALAPLMPIGLALFIGVVSGVIVGALMGTFLAWMSVTLKLDQIIGGTVINILALGLTSYFYVIGLTTLGKLSPIALGPLADIPLIGPVLFNRSPIQYLAIILVFVVQFALFRTVWGLRTRAVGEKPGAADTVGINVKRTRYINVTIAGCFAGLAGAYLTLESVGTFERGMTNGRGFIALAVMIFGRWTPLGSWGAALLFGFATALKTQLDFMGLNVPPQLTGSMPYILTIIVLAGFAGRARPPAAVGQVYESE